jgi:hypothetical protein
MHTLNAVLRAVRGEPEPPAPRDHLAVFREFLDHLDRVARAARERPPAPRPNGGKP